MGWFWEEAPEHEGWVASFIEREGCGRGSRIYRELCYPADDKTRLDVVRIGAACECGWRSPHLEPSGPVRWYPFSSDATPADEERCRVLWVDHARPPVREGSVEVKVRLLAEHFERLGVLGEDVAEVLAELADHAQQGVYRPGAWERGWLEQAFGSEWTAELEQDPAKPYFQRRRKQ